MQLRQLEHFEAVYRLRSFTRAAHEHFVSQSALSRSIRALEDELGQSLFDRTTHEVEPTSTADALIVHATDALAATRALSERAAAIRGGGTGTVRIGTGPYPAQPLMTRVVRQLSEEHPGLQVVVAGGASSDLLSALLRRELDFVVCDTSKFADSPFAEDIAVLALPSEPLVLVAGAEHPITQSEPSAADIAALPWVLPPPAPIGLRSLPDTFVGLARQRFPLYEMETTIGCLEVTRDQRTVTLVPLSLAATECAGRGLAYRSAGERQRTNDGVHLLNARSQSASVQRAIEAVLGQAEAVAEAGRAWIRRADPGWIRPA